MMANKTEKENKMEELTFLQHFVLFPFMVLFWTYGVLRAYVEVIREEESKLDAVLIVMEDAIFDAPVRFWNEVVKGELNE